MVVDFGCTNCFWPVLVQNLISVHFGWKTGVNNAFFTFFFGVGIFLRCFFDEDEDAGQSHARANRGKMREDPLKQGRPSPFGLGGLDCEPLLTSVFALGRPSDGNTIAVRSAKPCNDPWIPAPQGHGEH